MKVKLRRLIGHLGREAVVRRIREADVSQGEVMTRAWLVLAAAGEPDPRESQWTGSA